MKQIWFLLIFSIVTILTGVQSALGQTTGNTIVQSTSPRVAASRNVPTTVTKPVTSAHVARPIVTWPMGLNPQKFNSNLPRTAVKPAINLPRSYAPPVRSSNLPVATVNAPHGAPAQATIKVDPAVRQTESRTLAAMHQRRGIVTREGNILDPATRGGGTDKLATTQENRGLVSGQMDTLDAPTRDTELRPLETLNDRRELGTRNQTLATIDPQRHVKKRDPQVGPQRETRKAPKEIQGKKWHNKKDRLGYDDAFRRHWHERHDRNWWHNHCETIVFVTTGYYFLDGSYWYPAWGYDPLQSYYDYDGPIYTYGDLLPDEVIANVQTALQGAGYYFGAITGSLSIDTRAAIANFQRDYGLQVTGAIDEATVEALGLFDAGGNSDFQTAEVY